MKKIFYILFLLIVCASSQSVFGQQKSNPRLDSIKLANQIRKDLMMARLDSIKQAREEAKERREELAKEKKKALSKSKKNKSTIDETTDFSTLSKADSIKYSNQLRKENVIKRQDSIYEAREILKEKKRQELEDKLEKIASRRSKKIVPFTQEISIGYKLATDGWSFFANRGFIKTEDDEHPHTNFLWFDLSEKHNPKETNSLNTAFIISFPNEPKPVSYKYGKINNFYQFKVGYGNMKPISGKLDRKNVIINWVYGAGLSIGILKPYYLDLFLPEGNNYVRKFAKYSETNKPYFLDLNNQGTIIGGADFTKGISEVQLKPGLALRSGFYFDYSATKKMFMGIEIGASAEIYTQPIEIMAITNNPSYFFNLFADFRFGKRWE